MKNEKREKIKIKIKIMAYGLWLWWCDQFKCPSYHIETKPILSGVLLSLTRNTNRTICLFIPYPPSTWLLFSPPITCQYPAGDIILVSPAYSNCYRLLLVTAFFGREQWNAIWTSNYYWSCTIFSSKIVFFFLIYYFGFSS